MHISAAFVKAATLWGPYAGSLDCGPGGIQPGRGCSMFLPRSIPKIMICAMMCSLPMD
jgi:hypothetical protein